MDIKPLTRKHIDEIMELDQRFGSSWSPDFYTQRLSQFGDLAFGAYKNKKLAGFIIGKKNPDGTVLISRVVVEKNLENHGIGSKLMNKLAHATKADLISDVRVSNTASIKMCKRCGFTKLPDKMQYTDGEYGYKFRKTRRRSYY